MGEDRACRQTRGPTSRTPNTKRASSRFSCEGTLAVGAIKNQGLPQGIHLEDRAGQSRRGTPIAADYWVYSLSG